MPTFHLILSHTNKAFQMLDIHHLFSSLIQKILNTPPLSKISFLYFFLFPYFQQFLIGQGLDLEREGLIICKRYVGAHALSSRFASCRRMHTAREVRASIGMRRFFAKNFSTAFCTLPDTKETRGAIPRPRVREFPFPGTVYDLSPKAASSACSRSSTL